MPDRVPYRRRTRARHAELLALSLAGFLLSACGAPAPDIESNLTVVSPFQPVLLGNSVPDTLPLPGGSWQRLAAQMRKSPGGADSAAVTATFAQTDDKGKISRLLTVRVNAREAPGGVAPPTNMCQMRDRSNSAVFNATDPTMILFHSGFGGPSHPSNMASCLKLHASAAGAPIIPRPNLYQKNEYDLFKQHDSMTNLRIGPSNDNTMAAEMWDRANSLHGLYDPWDPEQKAKPATITMTSEITANDRLLVYALTFHSPSIKACGADLKQPCTDWTYTQLTPGQKQVVDCMVDGAKAWHGVLHTALMGGAMPTSMPTLPWACTAPT